VHSFGDFSGEKAAPGVFLFHVRHPPCRLEAPGVPPGQAAPEIGYDAAMKNLALVLSGLLVGVVAGTFLVPWVRAEGQKPAGVKWQQFCEPAGSIAEASSMAGARGVERWELVGFFGGALCFKRPVPDAAQPGMPFPGSRDGI
jgi:hypothetical protein